MNETERNDIRQYEKDLLERILRCIRQNGGDRLLSSVVLTGSFGRDEPTYVFHDDGTFHLKSDVEIALVFPRMSQKADVEALIRSVSAGFAEDLNLMAISRQRVKKACNFNLSFAEPKYKTVFTFDLFNGSRTIWGQDFISNKKIAVSDIDPYEGKRLVANRIGELTYLQDRGSSQVDREMLRMQWKGKLMLAIASAWLISEGDYVSSYRGQFAKMKEHAQAVEELLGSSFFAEYEKVFLFLRGGGTPYEVSDDNLCAYVRCISDYLSAQGVRKPRINTVSRKIKYCMKYWKAGMPYGPWRFEEKIHQMLIASFCHQREDLADIALVWHRVLY